MDHLFGNDAIIARQTRPKRNLSGSKQRSLITKFGSRPVYKRFLGSWILQENTGANETYVRTANIFKRIYPRRGDYASAHESYVREASINTPSLT